LEEARWTSKNYATWLRAIIDDDLQPLNFGASIRQYGNAPLKEFANKEKSNYSAPSRLCHRRGTQVYMARIKQRRTYLP